MRTIITSFSEPMNYTDPDAKSTSYVNAKEAVNKYHQQKYSHIKKTNRKIPKNHSYKRYITKRNNKGVPSYIIHKKSKSTKKRKSTKKSKSTKKH
jgi:hypothetical protein